MKQVFSLFILLSVMAVYSCGKAGANTPGIITVDGQVLTLPYGMAIKEKESAFGKGGYLVYLFNHNKNTCEQVTATMRTIPAGEVSARVYFDSAGRMSVVGIDYHSQLGVSVKLLKAPSALGDEVAVLVPDKITFKPMVGKFKDKTITIVGVFKGKFCGDRQSR